MYIYVMKNEKEIQKRIDQLKLENKQLQEKIDRIHNEDGDEFEDGIHLEMEDEVKDNNVEIYTLKWVLNK